MAIIGVFLACLGANMSAQADIFGGDVAVLMQILQENIRHFYQLQQMIQQGRSADEYLHWINRGLDNSIGLLQALPIRDNKVLADLKDYRYALSKIEHFYGAIPQSPEHDTQELHDQSAAESLRMANDFKDFSEAQEKNSDLLVAQAADASPKGAARMQAQASADILRSLSQLIRLNSQMLKLQSEQLAMNNKESKDSVSHYQKINQDLGSGFSNFNADMKLTRF